MVEQEQNFIKPDYVSFELSKFLYFKNLFLMDDNDELTTVYTYNENNKKYEIQTVYFLNNSGNSVQYDLTKQLYQAPTLELIKQYFFKKYFYLIEIRFINNNYNFEFKKTNNDFNCLVSDINYNSPCDALEAAIWYFYKTIIKSIKK